MNEKKREKHENMKTYEKKARAIKSDNRIKINITYSEQWLK